MKKVIATFSSFESYSFFTSFFRLTEMNSREYLEQHEARLLEKASQDLHQNGEVVEA